MGGRNYSTTTLLGFTPGAWLDEAKCRGKYGEVDFYPDLRELGKAEFARRVRVAKEFCSDCPVKAECLKAGLESRDMGIWGGTTASERDRKYGVRQVRYDHKLRDTNLRARDADE